MLFGDMLQKLAEGEALNPAETMELRRLGNSLHERDTLLSSWIGVDGSLNVPHINAGSGAFERLPHEGAAMVRETALTVTTGTDTKVVNYDADEDLGVDYDHFPFDRGLKRNFTTGEISVRGVPGKSVYLMYGFTYWANDTSIWAGIMRSSDDKGLVIGYSEGSDFHVGGMFLRVAEAEEESFYLQVKHWRGSDNNLAPAMFGIIRLI